MLPEARKAKKIEYTAWLDNCDGIINFCKLKTHGMMGMSAAVKNLFGTPKFNTMQELDQIRSKSGSKRAYPHKNK